MNTCMKYARNVVFIALVLAALVALSGCGTTRALDTAAPPPRSALPAMPVDIRQCFNTALSNPPDRDLTVEEVEAAWKSDRVRFAVMRTCGKRFTAWYDNLRARWQ